MKKSQSRLELLRMARDLVMNAYIDKRAEDHNRWIVESEYLWRTQRMRLAYPIFPPYPTEADIIERADKLIEWAEDQEDEEISSATRIGDVIEQAPQSSTGVEPTVKQIENTVIAPAVEESSVAPNSSPQPEITDADIEYLRAKVASDLDDRVSSSQRLIPALLKKLEGLRTKKGEQ